MDLDVLVLYPNGRQRTGYLNHNKYHYTSGTKSWTRCDSWNMRKLEPLYFKGCLPHQLVTWIFMYLILIEDTTFEHTNVTMMSTPWAIWPVPALGGNLGSSSLAATPYPSNLQLISVHCRLPGLYIFSRAELSFSLNTLDQLLSKAPVLEHTRSPM